jgi:hypothetical protein
MGNLIPAFDCFWIPSIRAIEEVSSSAPANDALSRSMRVSLFAIQTNLGGSQPRTTYCWTSLDGKRNYAFAVYKDRTLHSTCMDARSHVPIPIDIGTNSPAPPVEYYRFLAERHFNITETSGRPFRCIAQLAHHTTYECKTRAHGARRRITFVVHRSSSNIDVYAMDREELPFNDNTMDLLDVPINLSDLIFRPIEFYNSHPATTLATDIKVAVDYSSFLIYRS